MHRVLSFLLRVPRLLLIGLVRAYQLLLSPHLGRTCRFHPTCSTYAIQAFREYGVLKGLVLTVHRLLRCHPWGGHGYDPPRWFGEEHFGEEHPASDYRPRATEERR
ncbi:membrane protein insertion efficiency factor YidD [Salinibacter altiplanensis]|uniref:membrane protein insertion efficiency factor YidD n=1 Tax=Salinibacter altiplanensis TaxID=1803181 RepID=UPI000C9ECD9D|nr:membrane protein insertion efficiency factor YidD [Salinibacter altiplanensis]